MSIKCSDISNVVIDSLTNGVLLDTNALLWAFYPNSTPSVQQAPAYSNFIANLINNNIKIFILSCNLSEAIFVAEKIEKKIYNKVNNCKLGLKQYRNIQSERLNVKATTSLMLNQILAIPQIRIIDCNDDKKQIESFVNNFDSHLLDFYDYKIATYSKNCDIPIVTDDADFSSYMDDISILTGNTRMLTV